MKAQLEDRRIEEEWRIRVDDLFRMCKIPLSHVKNIHVEMDEDFEEESEKSFDILVIRIMRDSEKDKRREKASRRKG